MKRVALILVLLVGLLLAWAARDFPTWGEADSPASASPVSSHFIANTGVDTEVPNMVTAVLAFAETEGTPFSSRSRRASRHRG